MSEQIQFVCGSDKVYSEGGHSRGGRTCSRASVEEFNLMSEICYFSLFWLDYGQLKKLHTANGNSSTHAGWAHAF